jgi:hypothetical protein
MVSGLGIAPTHHEAHLHDSRRGPLGLAVVGGLLIPQLITLYLTPVVYTYMAAIMTTRRIPVAGRSNPAMIGVDA